MTCALPQRQAFQPACLSAPAPAAKFFPQHLVQHWRSPCMRHMDSHLPGPVVLRVTSLPCSVPDAVERHRRRSCGGCMWLRSLVWCTLCHRCAATTTPGDAVASTLLQVLAGLSPSWHPLGGWVFRVYSGLVDVAAWPGRPVFGDMLPYRLARPCCCRRPAASGHSHHGTHDEQYDQRFQSVPLCVPWVERGRLLHTGRGRTRVMAPCP